MCFQPICAPAKVGAEGYLHPVGALHGLDDDALHQLLLLGVDAEVEFVVYLEYHCGAQALGTEAANVNVKATTEEKLGFTGSGEGISAHAVCIVKG